VKVYNDLFNQTLALSGMDGTDLAVVHSYEMGLKNDVQAVAAVMLMVHQNITFHEHQLLMIGIDKHLQHSCPHQSNQPQFTTPPIMHFHTAPTAPTP
jgi:hypothetical protein